jgi:hypothetical protein
VRPHAQRASTSGEFAWGSFVFFRDPDGNGQVIAAQAHLVGQPANPVAQRQAADADVADEAASHSQVVGLGR